MDNQERISLFDLLDEEDRPLLASTAVVAGYELVIPLEGLIDVDKEIDRLTKEQQQLQQLIAGQERKLANENFVSRAPENVVAAERTKLADYKEALSKVTRNLQVFE